MTITPSQAAKLEGDSGITEFDFQISQTGDAIIQWYVIGTGANPATPDEFAGGAFPSGSFSLASGQTGDIAVRVAGNSVSGPNQGFEVIAAEIHPAPAIGFHPIYSYDYAINTILNDDPIGGPASPAFRIVAADATKIAGTGLTPYTFTVQQSGVSATPAILAYSVIGIDGRPTPSATFANPTGTVTLKPGDASATITIYTTRPSNPGAQAFAVSIAAPGGGATSAVGAALVQPGLGPNDIAVSGGHSQYLVVGNPASQALVRDTVAGRDGDSGTPGLRHVAFSDGTGVLDPTGNAEIITRLYQAALDRAPDQAGLDLFTSLADTGGLTISALAASLATSPEFIRGYGPLDNSGFVTRLYQNVLHRPPDPVGARNFVNVLDGGGTRADALLSIANSPENRANLLPIAGDRNDAEAARLYQAALGRAPDAAGAIAFSAALANGQTPTQLAHSFVISPEFQARYGALANPADFIGQLYANVLHRAPDAAGLQLFNDALANGASRDSVLVGFADSVENRFNTASLTHDGWVFLPS